MTVLLSSVFLLNLVLATLVSSQCETDDLLPCDSPMVVSSSVLCCNDTAVCVKYSGTSVGSTATYNTSNDLCITTQLVRTCSQGMTWDGQTPTPREVAEEAPGQGGNPTLIYLGVTFFFLGVIYVTVGCVLALRRAKKHGGVVRQWFWCTLCAMAVLMFVNVVLWLALLGYAVSRDFTEGDGYMRSSNSSCESPSGKVAVRLALTIVCFVLSSFIQGFGAGILGASFRAVQFFAPDGTPIASCSSRCGKGGTCGKNQTPADDGIQLKVT